MRLCVSLLRRRCTRRPVAWPSTARRSKYSIMSLIRARVLLTQSGHCNPAWAKCTFRQYRRIARCGRAADLGFLRFSNCDIHAHGACSGPRRGCRSRAPGRPGAVGDSVPTNSNQVRKTCDGSCSAKRLARSRCFRMISAASVPSPARIAFATARCSVFDLARMSGVNAPLS